LNTLTFLHPVFNPQNEITSVLGACFSQKDVHQKSCRSKIRILAELQSNWLEILKAMNIKFTELMNNSISYSTNNNVLSLMNNSLSVFMQTIDQINSVSRDEVLKVAEIKIGELIKCDVTIFVISHANNNI